MAKNGNSKDKRVTFRLGVDSKEFMQQFKSVVESVETNTKKVKDTINKTTKQASQSAKKTASEQTKAAKRVAQEQTKEAKKTAQEQARQAKKAAQEQVKQSKKAAQEAKKQEEIKQAKLRETAKVAASVAKEIGARMTAMARSTSSILSTAFTNIKMKISGLLSGLRTTATLLATLAAYQIYQGVQGASDLEEVQNVVDTAFGQYANEANAFAKNAINTYGVTELMAKQSSGIFMTMGTAMGVANDQAKEMALNLTGLMGDISSYNNVAHDISYTALKSIYSGETEPLRQFGIVMTQVNLEAFALSRGIKKSYQEMSEAEKVALRYEYVLEKTKNQQGDFERTSDSFSNRLRVLKGNWQTFLSTLSRGLMQVLTPLLKTLNNIVVSLTLMAEGISNALTRVFGLQAQSGKNGASAMAAAYDEATSQIESDLDGVMDKQEELNGLAGFDKITQLAEESDNGNLGGDLNLGGGDGGANPFDFSEEVEESEPKINTTFERIFTWIKDRIDNAKTNFKNIFGNIDLELFKASLGKFGNSSGKFIDKLVEKAMELAKWFIEDIAPILLDIASVLMPLIIQIIESIDWKTIGEMIKTALEFILEKLKALSTWARENPDKFQKIVNMILLIVAAGLLLVPVVLKIVGGLISFAGIVISIITFLGTLGVSFSTIAIIVGVVIAGFASMIGIAIFVVAQIKNIINMLKALKNWFVLSIEIGAEFGTKLKQVFIGVRDKIKELFDNLPNLIKGGINMAIRLVNSMIGKINGIKIDVPDWVPEFGGKSYGFSIPTIPELEDGGVLRQPTLVKAGEYANAHSDPEIFSKESELTSIFMDCMDAFANKIVGALQQNNGGTETINLQVGRRTLMSWIKEENDREGWRRGTNPI